MAGPGAGGAYLTAYLVEKSLSLDNVFVFAVIFSSFAVPEQYRYHVLFYGVLGAIVFRGIFVFVGAALLSAFTWLVFVFGAFLVLTGLRMLRSSGEQADPQSNRALRLFTRILPATEDYHGDNFTVREGGKRYATPLLAVLVVVESSDVIFAIDSVPAVLSITQTTFVAYSSIVFAVLGLRALYFALEGLIDRFIYLHYGLAAILVFLGAEYVLQGPPRVATRDTTTETVSTTAITPKETGIGTGDEAGDEESEDGRGRQEDVGQEAASPDGTNGEAPASEETTESSVSGS